MQINANVYCTLVVLYIIIINIFSFTMRNEFPAEPDGPPPVRLRDVRPPVEFLKISGGRWETARESVGHRSVTAGTPRGETTRFCPVLSWNRPVTDGTPIGRRQAPLGLYSLLDFSINRWAMPKFQRRPSRLQIERSPLWIVTIALGKSSKARDS